MIDDQIMYVGSDNCYPNYHEEFGVWIEDKEKIKAWKVGNWDPRWEHTAKDAEKGTEQRLLKKTENEKRTIAAAVKKLEEEDARKKAQH
jgi:hypothetical protein